MKEYAYAVYDGFGGLKIERAEILRRTAKQIKLGNTGLAYKCLRTFRPEEVCTSEHEARIKFKSARLAEIEEHRKRIAECELAISAIDSAPVVDC